MTCFAIFAGVCTFSTSSWTLALIAICTVIAGASSFGRRIQSSSDSTPLLFFLKQGLHSFIIRFYLKSLALLRNCQRLAPITFYHLRSARVFYSKWISRKLSTFLAYD